MGTIRTTADMGMLDRCAHIVNGIRYALDHRKRQSRFIRDAPVHFAYEEYFSGKSAAANYQRGYLDHALHTALIRPYACSIGPGEHSWWALPPTHHLRWFHPKGKAKKVYPGKGKETERKEIEYHVGVLRKVNRVLLSDIDDHVHTLLAPRTPKTKLSDKVRWLDTAGHCADAAALALMLHGAITVDLDRNVPATYNVPQIALIKDIQDKYPGLASLR